MERREQESDLGKRKRMKRMMMETGGATSTRKMSCLLNRGSDLRGT